MIDCIPRNELLCQLAEEASELAQAALKLRRAYDKTNPTPVPKEEAIRNMMEEVADVWLIVKTLGLDQTTFVEEYQKTMARKTNRWANRLDEQEVHA